MSHKNPRRFSDWLVARLADLWYRLDRRRREITRRNLAFAYGPELSPEEVERIARGVFRHFVRFAWEMVELLIAPPAFLKRRVVLVGMEHVEPALKQGRGLIAIAVHAGNWEYTVMGFCLKYLPVAVVAREMDSPWGARLARYLRERCGNRMVDKRGGLKEILRQLRQNRVVGIVMDQNTAAADGLLVDFFGKAARTTPVAAILARHRDIPVLPMFSRRLADGRHLMIVYPPIPMEKTHDPQADIRRHLELQSRAIEEWVRACPEQWLWLHRRWKNQFEELYKDL
jgi:KDO2-lipid IV(A) lauroyltransferase